MTTCDLCGENRALRISCEGIPKLIEPMLCCQECYTEPDWHDLPAAEIKLNDYNAQSAWVIWRLAGAFRLMRSTNGAPDKGFFVSRHPSLSAAQAKARAENPYINIWCEDEGGGFTRIYNAMTD